MRARRVAMVGTILFFVFATCGVESGQPKTRFRTMKDYEVTKADITFYGSIAENTPAGEPVELILKVQNNGKAVLQLNDDVLRAFLITIKAKDGEPVRKTSFVNRMESASRRNMSRDVVVFLPPNRKASVKVDLRQVFDLTLGGHFVATIECKTDPPTQKIKLDSIQFTVEQISLPNLLLERP